MSSGRGAEGLGRYADPAPVILTSLAGGPKHGYAIIKDVEAMGGPTLGPGTLYGVLERLQERGLVEALPADDRRRPYRLTERGTAVLREQLAHMERVTTAGLLRLGLA